MFWYDTALSAIAPESTAESAILAAVTASSLILIVVTAESASCCWVISQSLTNVPKGVMKKPGNFGRILFIVLNLYCYYFSLYDIGFEGYLNSSTHLFNC